jgi:hypothetical protein
MCPEAVRNIPFRTDLNPTKRTWAVVTMATLLRPIEPDPCCRKISIATAAAA